MATTRSTPRGRAPRLPRAERREQLLDATLALIDDHGFAGLSMEAVAREAGIAKTVVYDAFGDQRGLLQALLEREQERALASIAAAMPSLPLEGDPSEILASSLTAWLEEVRRNPRTWRFILVPAAGTPPSVRQEVDRHRERLVGEIEPVVSSGMQILGLADADAELAAHVIVAGAEDAARLTLTHPRRFPPARFARFASELLGRVQGPRR